MRRRLVFESLDSAIAEMDSLLENGYLKTGNWSLAQICSHVRLTMESNMNGYPKWMVVLAYPLRPFLRTFGLPNLLKGKSPAGLPTAGIFVPAKDLSDLEEVQSFKRCVQTFRESTTPLHAHPGFGVMTREEFGHFHAAHAAHHLGFLVPQNSDQ